MDVEVSSNSSGEMVEVGALPEGLDISWAQPAQTWQLARWCVARAHSVVRAVAKVMSISNARRDMEGQKAAGKLHVKLRAGGKGARYLPSAEIRGKAREKVHAVLGALRKRTEVMDDKAERTLSALAVCDVPRAQELYQLGLRVHDPTVSEKSFRRVLADLGLAKAPRRPWRGRRQEAQAAWSQECAVVLWRWRRLAGVSEPSAAAGSERASADSVAEAAGATEASAAGNGESSSAVGVASAAGV